MTSLLLISAPFGSINLPSIGLSLLRDQAIQAGHNATIRYLTFDFANVIGVDLYNAISLGYPANTLLAGDFLFSIALHERTPQSAVRFYEQHLEPTQREASFGFSIDFRESFYDRYLNAANHVSAWVKSTAEAISQENADVFGFTSMFQQNIAALAIAKHLKGCRPEAQIIFGGPNCESKMGTGLLAAYPWIDFVCSGEGEYAIVSLLDFLARGRKGTVSANILTRPVVPRELSSRAVDLTKCGVPNYDDYFQQSDTLKDHSHFRPRVLLETSRGCWWGEKAHCTFCGLNGLSMTFRSKPPAQALREIQHLVKSYPNCPISVVDNIIDYKYFNTLLPLLSEEGIETELFYETKANLTRAQLELMARAGIRRIQPGIESLSTKVLSLMKKGISAYQNIQLLKQCMETGIVPEWNMLWGFPNEEPEEYHPLSNVVRSLFHLPPPNSGSSIRLDRFSPLYEQRDEAGVRNVRPYPAYFDVYMLPDSKLNELAYYFTFDYADARNVKSYTADLSTAINEWRVAFQRAYLFYVVRDEFTLIFDGRNDSGPQVFRTPPSWGQLLKRLERPCPKESATSDETVQAIAALCRLGIILPVDGRLYNLAHDLSTGVCRGKQAIMLQDLASLDCSNSQESYSIPVIDLCVRKERAGRHLETIAG